MIRIELTKGPSSGRCFAFEGNGIRIGRHSSNDLVITHEVVSKRHARIHLVTDGFVYEDLESTNGSIVRRSGEKHTLSAKAGLSVRIRQGDEITLGAVSSPVILLVTELEPSMPEARADLGDDDRTILERQDHVDSVVLASRPMEAIGTTMLDVEKNTQVMHVLLRQQREMLSTFDVKELANILVTSICDVYPDSANVTLFHVDAQSGALISVAEHIRDGLQKPTLSRSILKILQEENLAILFQDAREELHGVESVLESGIRSCVSVPLHYGGELRGVLQADSTKAAGLFNEHDLEIMSVFGNLVALYMEKVDLYERLSEARSKLKEENVLLRQEIGSIYHFSNIIGASSAMERVFDLMDRVLDSSIMVLIQGETGTGKDLIARALHYGGPRKNARFIVQNCAALPEQLLENELFGHAKGAFTGATEAQIGLFEAVNGGTIFLDEIGEMSLSIQAKLLRVLDEGEFRPVGSTEVRKVDMRVISATNRDLKKDVDEGRFREDLYYRLKVFTIDLPPLRERREDIPLLVAHFLTKYAKKYGKNIEGIDEDAMRFLRSYDFPGNVRELEHEIERAVAWCKGEKHITTDILSDAVRDEDPLIEKTRKSHQSLGPAVDSLKRHMIIDAIAKWGTKARAAEELGIPRQSLHKTMQRLGIEEE